MPREPAKENTLLRTETMKSRYTKCSQRSPKKFILLFSDKTSLRLPRLLKRGFRHCKVILEINAGWLFVNPLDEELEIYRLPSVTLENVCKVYTEIGFIVIYGTTSGCWLRSHPANCVAVAKRLIGVQSRWVWTPYDLFLHMRRNGLAKLWQVECAK